MPRFEIEPKYKVAAGQIVTRATGIAIPADEPYLVVRGSDPRAVNLLGDYGASLHPGEHLDAVEARYEQFQTFRDLYPDRMGSRNLSICASGSAVIPLGDQFVAISGDALLAEEPLFVFRGKDRLALRVLPIYMIGENSAERDHARELSQRFLDFAQANPSRLRLPDTAPESKAIVDIDRQQIIRRGRQLHGEIVGLLEDAEHWNSSRPLDDQIDPDPDGQLKRSLAGLEHMLGIKK